MTPVEQAPLREALDVEPRSWLVIVVRTDDRPPNAFTEHQRMRADAMTIQEWRADIAPEAWVAVARAISGLQAPHANGDIALGLTDLGPDTCVSRPEALPNEWPGSASRLDPPFTSGPGATRTQRPADGDDTGASIPLDVYLQRLLFNAWSAALTADTYNTGLALAGAVRSAGYPYAFAREVLLSYHDGVEPHDDDGNPMRYTLDEVMASLAHAYAN